MGNLTLKDQRLREKKGQGLEREGRNHCISYRLQEKTGGGRKRLRIEQRYLLFSKKNGGEGKKKGKTKRDPSKKRKSNESDASRERTLLSYLTFGKGRGRKRKKG